eukprot:4568965-Pleurochrysis_carterae.AAC.1
MQHSAQTCLRRDEHSTEDSCHIMIREFGSSGPEKATRSEWKLGCSSRIDARVRPASARLRE